MNCLSAFDHFVGLALKGLISFEKKHKEDFNALQMQFT